MKLLRIITATVLFVFAVAAVSYAGEADVIDVEVKKIGDNTYQFSVTVSHNDEGWEHYADKWDIIAPDGQVLGTRTLLHPHVDEQPFTRSLSGVKIPEGITEVTIRAHDSVHEYGGKVIRVTLPQ
jgi:pyruvate-formate lyase-activating enzyme